MRVLVTGDRNWGSESRENPDLDRETIKRALAAVAQSTSEPVTLIHGKARGVDRICGEAAAGLDWQVVECPADWEKFGKAAGPIRNNEMLAMIPDVVLGFHDDIEASKGTRHCLSEALKKEYVVLLINSEGSVLAIPEDL